MSAQKETIEKYRRFISSRYRWYGWAAGVVCLSGVLLNVWLDSIPWQGHFTSGLIGLGLGFMWYTFYHRFRMLTLFDRRNPDAFQLLEKYLLDKRKQWDRTYMFRLGGMLVLGLLMLVLLFFYKESTWAGTVASLFIALILASIIKGWLDFNDEILLHDIRRSQRDQTSE